MRYLLIALLIGTSLSGHAQSIRIVFVVDKVSQTVTTHDYGSAGKAQEGEHHSAPVVMAEFGKRCPIVSFTQNRDSAEFILQTQSGGSTLSNAKGDVLYVSPAKTLGNMVKDVCTYVTQH